MAGARGVGASFQGRKRDSVARKGVIGCELGSQECEFVIGEIAHVLGCAISIIVLIYAARCIQT